MDERMVLCLLTLSTFFLFVNNLGVASVGSRDVQPTVCHSCAQGGYSDTCYCDSQCTLYNDCCFDAPAAKSKRFQTNARFSCSSLGRNVNIYLIDQCARQWWGSAALQRKCEDQSGSVDISMAVPVTDMNTNITYRNVYCAECNNVEQRNLLPFHLSIQCHDQLAEMNDTYGFVIQNILNVNGYWGIYHWNQNSGDMEFMYCSIFQHLPISEQLAVRRCDIDMVSTCSHGWNFEPTRHRCMSTNMHIVYGSYGKRYRNIHCAVCNYIPANDISCRPPQHGFGFGGGFSPNFNMLTYAWNACGIREVYDSKSDKCRRMYCPGEDKMPFYGECIKKTN